MSKAITLVLAVVVSLNVAMAQSEEITGVVVAMPGRHFKGSPQRDWPVTAIHFKVGDRVKAGDCLIELDPAELPKQKAQAQLEATKCHIEVVKAQLRARKLMLERCSSLIRVNAVCQQEYEDVTEAVEALKHQLAQAEADERAATAELAMVVYNFVHYQRINSLIDGEIVAINCALGMVARATDRQLVWVEVIDSSRVHIHCLVPPETAVGRLIGTDKLLSIKDARCVAKVVAVPRIIVNGKVDVILEADNLNLELIVGQEVKLKLPQ